MEAAPRRDERLQLKHHAWVDTPPPPLRYPGDVMTGLGR